MNKKANIGLVLLGIVAVIALVGLVLLFKGGKATGNVVAGNVQFGVMCPGGVLMLNPLGNQITGCEVIVGNSHIPPNAVFTGVTGVTLFDNQGDFVNCGGGAFRAGISAQHAVLYVEGPCF